MNTLFFNCVAMYIWKNVLKMWKWNFQSKLPICRQFLKRCLVQSAHNLTQSLFLKKYIMLISQFRSRFYLRKVLQLFLCARVCTWMYMCVHTIYVFVCMCMLGAVASKCFMYEPDFWNSETVELYNQPNVGTKFKMFYSQMYIKFISKTIQADKYLHAIFQIWSQLVL